MSDVKVKPRSNPKEFLWMERRLIDHGVIRKVGASAWAVYSCLARHAGKENSCFPSEELLCRETGLGRTTVSRAIRILREEQLIVVGKRKPCSGGHPSNSYTLLDADEFVRLNPPLPRKGSEGSSSPSRSDFERDRVRNLNPKESKGSSVAGPSLTAPIGQGTAGNEATYWDQSHGLPHEGGAAPVISASLGFGMGGTQVNSTADLLRLYCGGSAALLEFLQQQRTPGGRNRHSWLSMTPKSVERCVVMARESSERDHGGIVEHLVAALDAHVDERGTREPAAYPDASRK